MKFVILIGTVFIIGMLMILAFTIPVMLLWNIAISDKISGSKNRYVCPTGKRLADNSRGQYSTK